MKKLISSRIHHYYWDEDLCCTLTALKILAELYPPAPHPQILDAAFGLNAGRCGSQCGLVEGTLLFLGTYSKENGWSPEDTRQLCRDFCQDFQARLGSLICTELRPQGFSPDNPPHLCEKLSCQALTLAHNFIARNFPSQS
ncbi:MAG TPA: C-GCAxxG-C-C family protein [Patescibacteria group bacterium]|nr:C-GCAxxG-C-C family protein [Patescibacteria group bacterium]